MFQDLIAAFNGNYALPASIMGIIVLLIKTLTMLGYAWDLYDTHFVVKAHRRLLLLRKSITEDALLADYLDDAINLETFRLASGIRASALKASALMTLSKLGHWDAAQIRLMSRYLVVGPENPEPKIVICSWAKFSAWGWLLAGGLVIIVGAIEALFFLFKIPIYGFFIGVALFIPMIFAGGWLATDFGRYRIARRVQEYLEKNPETFSARE